MIAEAITIVQDADIFAVVGSSLVVYPAAGLVHYAPEKAWRFIIDKRIPYMSPQMQVTAIEKPATEGVEEFRRMLLRKT